MSKIVTARVPAELKRQADAALSRIGATPTQLINAAYEYVIANDSLPMFQGKDNARTGELTKAQIEELRSFFESSTSEVPRGYWGTGSYKELIAKGRRADYEALSRH